MSDIERTERETAAVVDAVAWPTGPLTEREKHFVRLLGEMREDRDRWRNQARVTVDRVALLEMALEMAADDAERFPVEQYVEMAERKVAAVYGASSA